VNNYRSLFLHFLEESFTFGKPQGNRNFEDMLEFCKEILTKVSFDRFLFRKELEKSIRWMKGEELDQLKQWCLATFGTKYRDIIANSFQLAM
jgi:hypothetical protein